MIKFDSIGHYLNFALDISRKSACKRLQVGCVVTTTGDPEIYLSSSHNQGTDQFSDCESDKPGMCGHVHAEVLALAKSMSHYSKKIMYLTHNPCLVCAKLIVLSNVIELHYLNEYRDITPIKILKAGGVKVFHYKDTGVEEKLSEQ